MTAQRSRWLIHGTFYALTGLLLSRGVGLLRSALVARLLGPLDFGAFSLLTSFLQSATVFSLLGLPTATTRFVSEQSGNSASQGRILGAVWLAALSLSIAIGSGIFVFAEHVAVGVYENVALVRPVQIVAGVIIFQTLASIGIACIQGFENIRLLSFLNAVQAILTAVVVVTLASYFKLSGALAAWLISACLFFLLVIILLRGQLRHVGVRLRRPDLGTFKRVFSFSTGALVAGSFVGPVYWIGDTLLALSDGMTAVGSIGIARTWGQIILFLPTAVAVPLLPMFSKANPQASNHDFARILRVIWLFGLWLALSIGLAGRWIIPVAYGVGYSSAVFTLYAYCVVSFLMAISSTYGTYFTGAGLIWQCAVLNFSWALLFVVISAICVPRWKTSGLLAAYVVSHLYFAISVGSYARRRLAVRVGSLRLLVSVSCFILLTGFLVVTSTNPLYYMVGSSLLLLVGPATTWRLLLSPDDRASIRRWVATASLRGDHGPRTGF